MSFFMRFLLFTLLFTGCMTISATLETVFSLERSNSAISQVGPDQTAAWVKLQAEENLNKTMFFFARLFVFIFLLLGFFNRELIVIGNTFKEK